MLRQQPGVQLHPTHCRSDCFLATDPSSFVQEAKLRWMEAEPLLIAHSTNWNSLSGQDREGRTIRDWLLAPTNEMIERRLLHCGSLEMSTKLPIRNVCYRAR